VLDQLDAQVSDAPCGSDGAVRGAVVDDVDAVDEGGDRPDRLADQLLLVVRGDDDRHPLPVEHVWTLGGSADVRPFHSTSWIVSPASGLVMVVNEASSRRIGPGMPAASARSPPRLDDAEAARREVDEGAQLVQQVGVVDVGATERAAGSARRHHAPDDQGVLAEAFDHAVDLALEVEPAPLDEDAVDRP
jgi:hypothetical protein